MSAQANSTDNPTANTHALHCIACGSSDMVFLGQQRDYPHMTCRTCQTIQIAPIPDQQYVENYYASSNFSSDAHENSDADGMRESSRAYYAALERVLNEYQVRGAVVDYGTGWGGLCDFLIKAGYQCRGIELSIEQVRECQRRGLPVEQRSLASLVDEGIKADALVLSAVFEHFASPDTFIKTAHDLLSDNGLFVSLQPTAPFANFLAWFFRLGSRNKPLPTHFWIFDAPWHIALYSIEGMKQLTEKHGFELLEVRPAPQGRVKGLYGLIQLAADLVNRPGWALFKTKWPLMTSHIFVFRKKSL